MEWKEKITLANGDYDLLHLLAQCRNETNSKYWKSELGLDSLLDTGKRST